MSCTQLSWIFNSARDVIFGGVFFKLVVKKIQTVQMVHIE